MQRLRVRFMPSVSGPNGSETCFSISQSVCLCVGVLVGVCVCACCVSGVTLVHLSPCSNVIYVSSSRTPVCSQPGAYEGHMKTISSFTLLSVLWCVCARVKISECVCGLKL